MSSEELREPSECPNGDIFAPKKQPKAIRVLTVLAYVLSVSMAAILLSIYYIFMWEGKPHLGALVGQKIFDPQYLRQKNYTSENVSFVIWDVENITLDNGTYFQQSAGYNIDNITSDGNASTNN